MTIDGLMGEIPDIRFCAYLSIDPGLKTGICFWAPDGKPYHYNEITYGQIDKFLDFVETHGINLKQIIVEEWVLYQKKALAQSGSRLETVQIIGMVKRTNYRMQLPTVIEVRADNKDIAAQWSGMKIPPKTSHMPNWQAAYLVGYWWLHKVAKVIPARILEQT